MEAEETSHGETRQRESFERVERGVSSFRWCGGVGFRLLLHSRTRRSVCVYSRDVSGALRENFERTTRRCRGSRGRKLPFRLPREWKCGRFGLVRGKVRITSENSIAFRRR